MNTKPPITPFHLWHLVGPTFSVWHFCRTVLAQVGDEYLDMEQRYKLVTKAYLGKGKDGYDSLAKAEVSFVMWHFFFIQLTKKQN